MTSVHKRVGFMVVVTALLLGACGGDDDDDADSASTDSTADATADDTGADDAPGQTAVAGTDDGGSTPSSGECPDDGGDERLTMGVYSETAGLDPTVSTGGGVTGATELSALYDTLMVYDDERQTWEPNVAESLEPNGDATEWTLTLRDGVRFGNGDPLTATAVKASVERHQSDQTAIRSRGLTAGIDRMDVVDDRTLIFHLADPWGSFPFLLAGEVGMIVNPAVVDELGPDEFNIKPVGGGVGPYEPVRFVPGEEIVMRAKDDYWGGPVCIDELRFVAIPSAEATYEAFRNGEIDAAFLRGPRVVEQAKADGVASHIELLNAGAVMLLNSGAGGSHPATADVRIRRAIAAAIDPAQIDQRAYEGAGLPTTALFHPDSRYASDLDGPAYDPELAKRLVEEVEAEGSWDGSVTLACDSTWADEALSVAGQLESVGFQVESDVTASVAARIQRVIVDHDYDIACWGMSLAEASPWTGLARHVETESASTRTGYSNPEMDAALADLKAAIEVDDQQAALARIQEIWNDTAPTIVTAAIEELIIWQDDVSGLDFNQETVALFDDASIG